MKRTDFYGKVTNKELDNWIGHKHPEIGFCDNCGEKFIWKKYCIGFGHTFRQFCSKKCKQYYKKNATKKEYNNNLSTCDRLKLWRIKHRKMKK